MDTRAYPFLLGPAVAALAMSGSTFVVAMNALLLKRTKLAGIRKPDSDKPAPLADDKATLASSAPPAASAVSSRSRIAAAVLKPTDPHRHRRLAKGSVHINEADAVPG